MSPEQLLGLLPNTVLSAALYFFIKRELATQEAKEKRADERAESTAKAISEMRESMATKAMLESVGSRFDMRTAFLERENAVIRDRMDRSK